MPSVVSAAEGITFYIRFSRSIRHVWARNLRVFGVGQRKPRHVMKHEET
jgi:hypothetical protein